MRESWVQMVDRCTNGLIKLGKLTPAEADLIRYCQLNFTALTSGRWQWVGGTEWVSDPVNYQGAYNCSNLVIDSFDRMALCMDLLMQGCGVGTIIETDIIAKLPKITTRLELKIVGYPGLANKMGADSHEKTLVSITPIQTIINVGDSRQGWVSAYEEVLKAAAHDCYYRDCNKLTIDLSHVRAAGTPIKGFGGVSNPSGLKHMLERMVEILNGAVGRRLNSVEVTLLMDEPAKAVVAGNVRRSANIRQFSADDELAATAKDNLWIQDGDRWLIDPKRDALRMSNHTRVFHYKPTLEECVAAIQKQYNSGEGAIQWAGEAVARANADLLTDKKKKQTFLSEYEISRDAAREYLEFLIDSHAEEPIDKQKELDHRMMRYGMNPCYAPGTMILTRDGHFPIESLVGKTVEVWDGNEWVEVDNFHVTAENQPVYSVNLQDGQSIVATDYHAFALESGERKLLKNLQPGDRLLTHDVVVDSGVDVKGAYLKGFLIGDGTNAQGHAKLSLYTPKYCCEDRLLLSAYQLEVKDLILTGGDTRYTPKKWGFYEEFYSRKNMQGLAQVDLIQWVKEFKTYLPNEVFNWSLKSKYEFIAGVMDADGCAMDSANGFGYQITSIHKRWLLDFQLLLKTIGINSKMNPTRKGGAKDFGKEKGGVYEVKDTYRLSISQISSVKLSQNVVFSRLKSFSDRVTKYSSNPQWNKVISIEFSHIADKVYCATVPTNNQFSLSSGITACNCGEIIGTNFFCNLSEVHLNRLVDPSDLFKAAALSACALLHHNFIDERMQYSRENDPIIGVSFTGLFDFFVNLFGVDWLHWWQAGRPKEWNVEDNDYVPLSCVDVADYFRQTEQECLDYWKSIVESTVAEYCDRHGIKKPNRCTTVQPAGTKSLLTGASAGWAPPKAARFLRRITFAKNDPVALAANDCGYSVVPSQSDKDENGNLLNDPFDPRCTEWLVEVPIAANWADLEGVDEIDISQFSALAQFDFYMQIQKYYVGHNTSATIEFRESEVEPLAKRIYEAIRDDEGYISAALLARFDDKQTYPRLPFEPIDKATYERHMSELAARRKFESFDEALAYRDLDASAVESVLTGPIGCDSDKCLLPERPKSE
jgi:ribonucleotide reductase class II